MKSVLWVLTIIGSLIGGLVTFGGVVAATGAPQEAAAAAMGVACAVIPYCLARAVSEIGKSGS
jgi:sugar phosphate permease